MPALLSPLYPISSPDLSLFTALALLLLPSLCRLVSSHSYSLRFVASDSLYFANLHSFSLVRLQIFVPLPVFYLYCFLISCSCTSNLAYCRPLCFCIPSPAFVPLCLMLLLLVSSLIPLIIFSFLSLILCLLVIYFFLMYPRSFLSHYLYPISLYRSFATFLYFLPFPYLAV